jgi:hypothetical protein
VLLQCPQHVLVGLAEFPMDAVDANDVRPLHGEGKAQKKKIQLGHPFNMVLQPRQHKYELVNDRILLGTATACSG